MSVVAENDAAKVAHYSLGPRVAFRTHLARACSRTERAFEPRPRRHGVPTPNDDRTALDRRPRDYHRPANPLPPPFFSPLLPPTLHTIVSAPKCARSSRSESSERTTFSPVLPLRVLVHATQRSPSSALVCAHTLLLTLYVLTHRFTYSPRRTHTCNTPLISRGHPRNAYPIRESNSSSGYTYTTPVFTSFNRLKSLFPSSTSAILSFPLSIADGRRKDTNRRISSFYHRAGSSSGGGSTRVACFFLVNSTGTDIGVRSYLAGVHMAVYRGSSTYSVGGVRVVPPSVRVDVTRFHGSSWKRQRPNGSEVFRAEEHPLSGEGWPGERAATDDPRFLVRAIVPDLVSLRLSRSVTRKCPSSQRSILENRLNPRPFLRRFTWPGSSFRLIDRSSKRNSKRLFDSSGDEFSDYKRAAATSQPTFCT